MSFDIPAYIEPRVEQFAHAQHISATEAVVRLIETGLSLQGPNNEYLAANPALAGLGLFGSSEDAAALDAAVAIAYRERHRPSVRTFGL